MSLSSMSSSTSNSAESDISDEERVTMENFALIKVLGKGAYGKVFMARKVGGRDHGTIYAMKVLRKSRVLTKAKTLEHTMAERHVLERLKGLPFLVNLVYAFQSDAKLHIVMEFVKGGELFTHLCSRGSFDIPSAKFIIAELVVAIDSVHKRNVVYRDLKLENILLDDNGHIKLTDFGLSKELSEEEQALCAVAKMIRLQLHRANSYCGTIEYMAPEVVDRTDEGYDETVDWWSLGVIAFELLTGCSPFTVDGHSNNSRDIARRILTKKVPFPKNFDPVAMDFVGRLLEKSPKRRLGKRGVEEIKQHPFLADIDWEKCEKKQLLPPIVPKVSNDMDATNFAAEFTNQLPVYSPADTPVNAFNLFRGYSFVSPSVIFSNNNVIGEECLADDFQALVSVSPFFSKYKLIRTEAGFLGRGSFSVCRKCERLSDGASFAVKIVSQRFQAQATREASILEIVGGHPNIVRLFDVISDNLHIYLVLELLEGGELLSRIKKMETFTEALAGNIMRQLVSAVAYLHSRSVVHRDLKPEASNILFESTDPQAKLRLVDFGFARLLPSATEHLTTPCFTLHYAAPEVLEKEDQLPQYNEQCDLWSLGVILFTMLSGSVPFHARTKHESATDIMARIRSAQFSFDAPQWRGISAEAKTLITSLLTVDPKKRLSLDELQRHPWLLNAAAHNETPLQTPTTLMNSHATETFNETMNAFLTANRDGFHLMEVAAAPLLVKRRGMKRKSGGDRPSSMDPSKKCPTTRQLESVPEADASLEMSRPSTLTLDPSSPLMDYRTPKPSTIRDTRDSV
uniref:Ribosomal protein S6 kinase n=1 Tax=Ascaris lumbricoides TaxID=6252 RepID=A0A0M3HT25_ASCLU